MQLVHERASHALFVKLAESAHDLIVHSVEFLSECINKEFSHSKSDFTPNVMPRHEKILGYQVFACGFVASGLIAAVAFMFGLI